MEFSESDFSDSDLEFKLYSQIHYSTEYCETVNGKTDTKNQEDHNVKNGNDDEETQNNLHSWFTLLEDAPSVKSHKTSSKKKVKFKDEEEFSCDNNWEYITNSAEESSSNVSGITLNIDKQKHEVSNPTWDTPEDDIQPNSFDRKRYYSPKTSQRCKNCDTPGHVQANCPQPRKRLPCHLCGKRGHSSKFCKDFKALNTREKVKTKCKRCGQVGHNNTECPDIWRQFHLTVKPGKLVTSVLPSKPTNRMYCFNCSRKGHCGYQCKKVRYKPYFSAQCSRIFKYDTGIHIKKAKLDKFIKKKKLKSKIKKFKFNHR